MDINKSLNRLLHESAVNCTVDLVTFLMNRPLITKPKDKEPSKTAAYNSLQIGLKYCQEAWKECGVEFLEVITSSDRRFVRGFMISGVNEEDRKRMDCELTIRGFTPRINGKEWSLFNRVLWGLRKKNKKNSIKARYESDKENAEVKNLVQELKKLKVLNS